MTITQKALLLRFVEMIKGEQARSPSYYAAHWHCSVIRFGGRAVPLPRSFTPLLLLLLQHEGKHSSRGEEGIKATYKKKKLILGGGNW